LALVDGRWVLVVSWVVGATGLRRAHKLPTTTNTPTNCKAIITTARTIRAKAIGAMVM
jgi:hypothetical protein